MTCESVREAISASLDGELPGIQRAEQEAHLEGCAACRSWEAAAHDVTRRARLAPAPMSSIGADQLIAAVRARSGPPPRLGGTTLARLGLVAVAAIQLGMSSDFLHPGHDHDHAGHLGHEVSSFGLAMALVFAWVAWRPARAAGKAAPVGAFAMLVVVAAMFDVVGGRAQLLGESHHLVAVAGWLLLLHLGRTQPPALDGPRGWRRTSADWISLVRGRQDHRGRQDQGAGRPTVRPGLVDGWASTSTGLATSKAFDAHDDGENGPSISGVRSADRLAEGPGASAYHGVA